MRIHQISDTAQLGRSIISKPPNYPVFDYRRDDRAPMALIGGRSFPNQQTLERSCPSSPSVQTGKVITVSLATHSDLSVTSQPPNSPQGRDNYREPTDQHATLVLIQDLIPSFKSICLGLSLRGGVHYRHYSGGQPRPGCDGVYASYLSVTDRLSVKRPNSLGCPRRQLLCTHRSIGCKLESNYTVA